MKIYIIDLDGIMYSGGINIDGVREFIDYFYLKNFFYIFLINNVIRIKKLVKEYMLNLGFKDIKEEDFFIFVMVIVQYIVKNYIEKKCFMLGESGLEEVLKECNFEFI